jgi:hypothetical protein
MLEGLVANGSHGVVVGFHAPIEARSLRVEIAFTPGGRQGNVDDTTEKTPCVEAQSLRQAHAVQRLGSNIWCTQINPSLESDGKKLRRDGLRPMGDHMYTMEETYPLVDFGSGLRILCVPLQFSYRDPKGVLVKRLQVSFGSNGCTCCQSPLVS